MSRDSFEPFLGDSLLDDYSRLHTALQSLGLAQFLCFTDLRLQLVYPATDGSETLGLPRDLVKYYYAIADIDVVAGLNFIHLFLRAITQFPGAGILS